MLTPTSLPTQKYVIFSFKNFKLYFITENLSVKNNSLFISKPFLLFRKVTLEEVAKKDTKKKKPKAEKKKEKIKKTTISAKEKDKEKDKEKKKKKKIPSASGGFLNFIGLFRGKKQ